MVKFQLLKREESIPDLLPVFKVKNYLDFPNRKNILSHARMYATAGGYHFNLISFENKMQSSENVLDIGSDSCMAINFNFSPPNSHRSIVSVFNSTGNFLVFDTSKSNITNDSIISKLKIFDSRDEQGWYWGVSFTIDCESLSTFYNENHSIYKDKNILGNVYKFSMGRSPHFGAVFEVKKPDIFFPSNLESLALED
ncbi:MAG: hypothetical protein GX222_01520 [Ruminococcaceae bacterium]|nr:hypothetical protein [Oscillospiraceae bacterium]